MTNTNVTQFAAYVQKTGNVLTGVSVSDNIMVGVSTLNQLEQYGLIRPTQVEDATIKDLKSDRRLAAANTIREQVQRRFDKPRIVRAENYSFYIEGVANGSLFGGAPPITLFCPCQGEINGQGVMLPYGSVLVNLDGETQTEARYMCRDREPETGNELFPFILYHGITALHAGNIMHDFNSYARPVAEKVVASLNQNGSLTRAVNKAITTSQISADKISRHNANVKKKQITSFSRLVAGVLGYATGSNALQRGAIARLTGQYNNGHTVIDENAPQAFLVRAIGLANGNQAIGKASEQVWALAGAFENRHQRQITKAEFEAAATAFVNTKGSAKANLKLQAAAQAIEYGAI